jgi:hypothetical protein
MPKGKSTGTETANEADKPEVEDVSDRISALEASQQSLAKALENTNNNLSAIVSKLTDLSQQKMPTVSKPETKIEAFKKAMLETKPGGPVVESQRSIQTNNPQGANAAWPKDSIVKVAESSPKYGAYQLDEKGEPVKRIYEYQCTACPEIEPCPRGIQGKKTKSCPKCGDTMERTPTDRFEKGTPAFGVIFNYMYTNRKGIRKYKVYFEKFSERQRSEGMLENELILCQ